jgi:LytTr DNA-binding domain
VIIFSALVCFGALFGLFFYTYRNEQSTEAQHFSLRYLSIFSVFFCIVLVGLNANAGFEQNRLANGLAWSVQVPSGFCALGLVWHALSKWPISSAWPAFGRVLASAFVASALLAPLYLVTEFAVAWGLGLAFPDALPTTGLELTHEVAQEWFHMIFPFIGAWVLVTMPALHKMSPVLMQAPAVPNESSATVEHSKEHASNWTQQSIAPTTEPSSTWQPSHAKPQLQAQALVLPEQIRGTWLAVRSELQYVRVWTERGNAMVLGSLGQVEQFFGSEGLRVHKSWWVSCQAVAEVKRQSAKAVLIMSNGLEIPVSRRKQQAVLQRLASDQKL